MFTVVVIIIALKKKKTIKTQCRETLTRLGNKGGNQQYDSEVRTRINYYTCFEPRRRRWSHTAQAGSLSTSSAATWWPPCRRSAWSCRTPTVAVCLPPPTCPTRGRSAPSSSPWIWSVGAPGNPGTSWRNALWWGMHFNNTIVFNQYVNNKFQINSDKFVFFHVQNSTKCTDNSWFHKEKWFLIHFWLQERHMRTDLFYFWSMIYLLRNYNYEFKYYTRLYYNHVV